MPASQKAMSGIPCRCSERCRTTWTPTPSSDMSMFPSPTTFVHWTDSLPALDKSYIQIVCRAGNAGIVRSNEHFQLVPHGIFALIDYLRHEGFKVLLYIGMILVCRNAEVCRRTDPVVIERITVEQNSAGSFNGSGARSSPGRRYTC